MNQLCYKTIFSKRLGALVAVGEHACNQSKGQGARAAVGGSVAHAGARFIGHLAVGFLWVGLAWSQTLPQGAQVVQGTVGVSQSGNQMAITQGTAKAVVNWQSFDIGQNAKVTVVQPSSQSVLLNRVLSDNPTQILGQLQANGQVVLVNPRGIVVGSDGSVSASAFTASSLNISDADFMAGGARYVRDGATGAVVNKGTIAVAPGGYVALLGATVQNEGRIVAPQGAVVMGAADAAVLPEALTSSLHMPVGRTGKIKLELTPATVNAWVKNDKSGVIVTEGGQVYMQAAAVHSAVAGVFQSGRIDTSGAQAGDVHLLADGGRIVVDGQITANSSAPNAKGGSIVIGRDLDTNVLAASTDASGATLESQGGFVETSGQWLNTVGTTVKAKDWLLDPYNVTISASASGTAYTDPGTTYNYTPGATSIVRASDIATSLNNGTNVTISTGMAGSAGADAGDIAVNTSITTTGASNTSLTLQAARNITFAANTNITRTGAGKLDVTLNSNYGTANSGAIVMNSGSGITSNGGNITLGGGSAGDGSGFAFGSVASTGGTLAPGVGVQLLGATLNSGSGNIAIRGKGDPTSGNNSLFGVLIDSATRGGGAGSQLSTTGGNIDITGTGGGTGGSGIDVGIQVDYNSTLSTTGTGNITLTGSGGSNSSGTLSHGLYIARGASMSTVNGNLVINGTGATNSTAGSTAKGVQLSNNTSLTSTGTGSISITGTGGQANGANDGVLIDGGGTSTISVISGNINITGNGGLGTNWNQGVVIQNTANITATSGSINITGKGGQGGIYNQAVRIDSGAATITTGTGNINITGTQGSGSSWGFDANGGTNLIRSTSGNVTLTADTMQFHSGATTISAASGTVTLQNKTAGTKIDVGGSDNQISSPILLGLQSAELAKITAANTIIGRNDSTGAGDLTVTSAMSLNNLGNVTMLSGNNIKVNAGANITKTTGTTDTTLSMLASNGVELAAPITSTSGKLNVVMTANGLTNGVAASVMTAAQRALSGGVRINITNINANGGDVTLTGTSYANGNVVTNNLGKGVQIYGDSRILGARNITLTGTAENQAGNESYGVVFQRYPYPTTLTATGDITITGTLQGAGNGSGVMSGTSGWNNSAPVITAGGKFTLRGNNRASATNTMAAINGASGGMQVSAVGDIVVQAETNNNASNAIHFWSKPSTTFSQSNVSETGNASFRSVTNPGGVASGNVLIQSNQGGILFQNQIPKTLRDAQFTALTDIVGKNITIDNTGAGMATGAGTAVTGTGGTQGATLGSGSIHATTGAITQGAGSATGSGIAGINFSDATAALRSITASGNLNMAGVSSSGMGITSNALLTGGAVNLVGTSDTSTGVSLTGDTKATTGNVSITGTNTGSSNANSAVILNKAVEATSGTVSITADTAGTSAAAMQLASGATLKTTNNAITLTTDSISVDTTSGSGATINAGTGTTTVQNESAGVQISVGGSDVGSATASARTLGLTNAEINRITAGQTIIGSSTAGNTTVSAATTTNATTGDITLITGGNVAVNAALNVGTKTLTLDGEGAASAVTQTAAITAANLALLGSNASFTLNNTSNDVGTLAANAKSVSYYDTNALTVGTVGSTSGITTTGTIHVGAGSNLSVTQAVSTTNSSTSAVTLNAGVPSAAGTAAGGDILVLGSGSVAVGSGGRATLYTGSVANSTALATLVGAGSGNFRYRSDEVAANYEATAPLGSGLYAIYRESPSITVTSGSTMTYGDTVPTALGSVTGLVNGDTVSFSVTGRVNSTSGNIKAGSYSIANTAAGLGYTVVTSAGTGQLVVAQKALTATTTSANYTYSGSSYAQAAAATSGLIAGDIVAVSGEATGTNAGTYTSNLTASGTDAGNYILRANNAALTINKANLTLSGTRVYDAGTTFAGEHLTATGVNNETFALTGTGDASNLATKNVQTNQALSSVTGLALGTSTSTNVGLSSNYNDLSTTGSSVSVTPKAATVAVTAASTTYSGVSQSLTTSTTGFISGDAITISGNATGTHVGTYSANLAAGGADAGNYTVAVTNADLAINKANLTLSGTRTYDASTTYAGQYLTATGVNGETFTMSGTGDASNLATKNVQINQALSTVTGLALGTSTSTNVGLSSNYNAISTTDSSVSVTPKALTLTAATDTKTYDGTTSSSGTVNMVGLQGTDTATATQAFASKNVLGAGGSTLQVNSGYSVNDGNSGNNYTVSTATATGTINKANLTLSGTREYDATTSFAGGALTATGVNGETFTMSGTGDASNLASKNVQTNQTMSSVTGLALGTSNDGGLSSNYNDISATGSSVSVTAKAATVNGTATSTTYNGLTQNQSAATSSGFITGDVITIAGQSSGKNAGTYTSALSVGGTDAGNYAVTVTNADLTINKANLALSGTRVYDATTSFEGGALTATGVNGETFAMSGTGDASNLASKNVQTNQALSSVTGLALGTSTSTNVGLSSNYNDISTTGSSVSVTAKAATVNGTATSTTFNGLTQAQAAFTNNGFITGDNITISGESSGKNAGTYTSTLSVGGTDAGNYAVTVTNADLTIAKANLSVAMSAQTKTYDGTTSATLASGAITATGVTVNGVAETATVSQTAGTYNSKNVVGATSVTANLASGDFTGASGVDLGNYNLPTTVTGTGTITAKSVTYAGLAVSNKTYDQTTNASLSGAAALGTVAVGAGLSTDGKVIASDTVSLSGTAVGTYAIKNVAATNNTVTFSGLSLAGGDASNYTLVQQTSLNGTGTIIAKTLTPTVTAEHKTYDGSNTATVSAMGSTDVYSGDTVTFSNTGASFSNRHVAKDGSGNVVSKTVTVGGLAIAGDDASNYALASTSATSAATITPKTLTLAAVTDSKTYNGTTSSTGTVTATALESMDSITATQSFASKDVLGTNGSTLQVNSGYTVNDGNSGNNYTVSTTTASGTINKANLTVTANADAKFVTRSDASGYKGVSYDGLVNDEAPTVLGGTLSITRTNAATNVGAGTYTGTLVASGLTSGNYTISFAPGDYTIVPANQLLISTSNVSTVYGTAPTYSTTAQYLDGTTDVIHTLSQSNTGNSFTFSDGAGGAVTTVLKPFTVNSGTAIAAGLSSSGNTVVGNFSILDTNPSITGANFVGAPVYVGTLTVTPKALTAAMAASHKVYDGNVTASVTGSSADIISGDKISFANTSATFNNKNVGTGKAVAVSGITIGDADAGNYVLQNSTASTTANVTPKAITLTAGSVSKTYDGGLTYTTQTADLTTLTNQLISGDSVSAATISYTNKNAGNGTKVVTLDNVTLSDGNSGGNYIVTLAGNSTSTITPKAVTLSVGDVSKTYDGSLSYTTQAADLTTLTSQLISGDSVSAATISYTDKNAASGNKVVTLDNVTLSDGNSGGNYSVTLAGNNSSTITQKALTAAYTASNKVYDGNTAATVAGASIDIVAGDTVSFANSAATFDTKNVGTGKAVSVSDIAISGTDAGNYSLQNTTTSTTADVTPKAITLTAGSVSKTYDGGLTYTTQTADLTTLTNQLISGDNVSAATISYADKNAASGTKVVTLDNVTLSDGNNGGNYTVTLAGNSTSTITPKAVTLSVGDVSKTYDGGLSYTTQAADLSTLTNQLISGDSVSAATISYADKNAASGNKVVTLDNVTLSDGNSGGNYSVTLAGNNSSTITQKALTAAYTASNKVYDGNTAAAVAGASSDIVAGDTVSFANSAATFDTKNVGTGKTVSVSGIAISGTDAGNYSLQNTTASTTADVTKKDATITGTATNLTYNATTQTQSAAVLSDFIADDLSNGTVAVTGLATGRNAGSYTSSLSATGADAGNYNVTVTNADLVVGKKDATITGTVTNLTYNAATQTQSAAVLDGFIASDVTGGTVAATGLATGRNAGTYASSLSATGADAGNYNVSVVNADLVVGKKDATITGTNTNVTYNATTQTQSAAVLDGFIASDVTGGTVAATGLATGRNAGSYTSSLSATGTDAGNYNVTVVNADLVVGKKDATITGTATNLTYNATTQTQSAAVLSGFIADDVSNGTVAAAGLATGRNAGTYTSNLSATGADAGNYNVSVVNADLVVGKKDATITGTNTNVTYNATTQTQSAAVLDGFIASDVTGGTVAATGLATGRNAGSYTSSLSATGADAGNYNVTVTNADLVVGKKDATITGTTTNVTYNAATQTQSAAVLSGFIADDVSNGTVAATGLATGRNAGSYTSNLSATGTDAGNYNVTVTNADLVVGKKDATITGTNTNVTYNATTQTQSAAVLDGFIASDVTGGTVAATGLATGRNAGTYASSLSVTGTDAGNYNVTVVNADLVVAQKGLVLTAVTDTKTYDGTIVSNAVVQSTGLAGNDSVIATQSFASKDVLGADGSTLQVNGTYTINDGNNGNNYNVSTVTAAGTLHKAALTVTANADAKFVTQADATNFNGASYTGLVNGEAPTVLGGALNITRTNASTNVAAGTYAGTLVGSGLTSGNYTISYANGNYTIVPANQLLIRTNNVSTIYGTAPTYSTTAQYLDGSTNLIQTLTQSSTGNSFTFSDGVGGSVTTVFKPFTVNSGTATAAGVSSSGNTVVGNFSILDTNPSITGANFVGAPVYVGTLTVTPKALTAAMAANNKVYDGGVTAAVTGSSADIVAGDKISFANTSATFNNKNVGTGKVVAVSGITIGDADAGNYTLQNSTASTTANITKKDVTLDSITAANKTYDGTTAASITAGSISGTVGSETLSVSGSGSFDNKNAGTGKTVTVSDVSTLTQVNGDNSGEWSNYNLTTTGSQTTTADIAKKAVTLDSLTASNKTYDGNTAATITAGTFSGTVGTETLAISGSGSFDTQNAGTNKTVTVADVGTLNKSDGTGNWSNYTLTTTGSKTTSADVTKANLTLSGSRVYDASTRYAGVHLTAAGVNGETFALTGAGDASNLSTKNVQTNQVLNSVTGLALGTSTNGGLSGNYNTLSTTGSRVSVTPKALTAAYSASDMVYNGQTAATVTAASSDIVSGDTVAFAHTGATFDTKNVGTNKTVSVTGIGISGADAANYNLQSTTASTTASITPKGVTLDSLTASSKTYDGTTAATITAGSISGTVGTETLAISGSGSFETQNAGTGKTVTVVDVGTLSKTDGSGNWSNYTLITTGSKTTTANITKKDVTLDSITAANKTYDGTTAAIITAGLISGTVGSETLSVSGSGSFDNKNAGTGKTVTVSDVSTLTQVNGDNGGNWSNYNLTTTGSKTTTANIAKKDASIIGAATQVTYNASTQAQGAAVLSGFIESDVTAGTVGATGLATGRNAGSYASDLSVIGTDAGNYNVTVSNANLVIEKKSLVLAAAGDTKTYDGTTVSKGQVTAEALAGSDTFTASQSFASKDVFGTNGSTLQVNSGYTINDGNGGNNYSVTTSAASGTIHKAALAVTANADAKFVTQADAPGYNGASYSGLVNGEDSTVLGGTLNITRTNASTNVGAGTYAGTLVANGLTSGNYEISYANGNYTIVPANQLLIRTNNVSTIYGTAPTYSTTAQYLDGNNVIHTLSQSGTGNQLTFSDGAGGSVSTVLKPYTGGAVAARSTSGQTVVGNYEIKDANATVSGSNFVGSPVYVGNWTVTPKQVSATANGVTKVYDGTTQMGQATLALNGQLSGDVLTVTGSGAFSQKDVGQNLSYAFSNMTLQGADQANYVLEGGTSISGNNGQITPATLTFSGTKAADKNFDGNTTAKVEAGTLVGLVGNETLQIESVKGQFDTSLVGKGKSVNVVYGLSNGTGGGLASNYTWSPVIVQADITAPLVQVVPTPSPLRPATHYSRLTYQGFGGMANTSAATGSINPAASALAWATCSPQKLESCICEESEDRTFDICYPANKKPDQAQAR